MHIDFSQEGNLVTLTAKLEDDDRPEFGKAKMAGNSITFQMPFSFSLQRVHPDLLALTALVSFSPWIGKRLTLPFGVSTDFSQTCAERLKIKVSNTSYWVIPRRPGSEARPGLSFSAGVDSLACLALMPENTVPLFSHRSAPDANASTLYRDDAPLHAIEEMNAAGYETYKVTSDLEWLRKPVGFGVDPAPAAPLILLADHFSLDAIAFGTIAEAAYRTGTEHFIDYADRGIFKKWQAAFQAAGLSYFNAVAPISEMGTTKIAREYKYGHLAQSCVRGAAGQPCMNCVKCFRKSLVEASFSGNWPTHEQVAELMSNRAIKNYLSTTPIRLEIVLMATLAKYDGDDPLLLALQDRVQAKQYDTSFTHAWYRKGINDMVPEKYRAGVIEKLNKYLPEMTDEQTYLFENFNIKNMLGDYEANALADQFTQILEDNQRVMEEAK